MEEQTQNTPSTVPAESAQTAPATAATPAISSTERVFATIGYVGPLFVLPLVVQPKSEYCKFHARQSMGLFALFFAFLVLLALIPWFGSIVTFVLFAAYILSMYKAYMGEMWKVPVVGALAQKIDFDSFLTKATATVANMNAVKESADKMVASVGTAVNAAADKANEEASKK